MSLSFDEVFGSAVDQSIKEWKSFQLCVEQGMGGQYTNEKLIWMTQTITEFFQTNRDLEVDEVIEFVAEIIDNEFDTIIEDGSLRLFATNIRKYFDLCSSGRLQEVIDRIEDMKKLNANRVSVNNSLEQNDNQMVVENQMKSLDINCEDNKSEEMDETDPESEGWTRVQRKSRK